MLSTADLYAPSLSDNAVGAVSRVSVAMSEIAGWDSFYVIVGSAADALIGLQFVVMTLIAEGRWGSPRAGRLFA